MQQATWQPCRLSPILRRLSGHTVWLSLFILVLAACSPTVESASAAAPSPQRVIQNKGSDTLVNLALAWAEAYRQVNPDLLIAVTGGGSGTALPP